MGLVLLCWIVGSALFFLGWVLGIVMARRPGNPERHAEPFCEACYLRQVATLVGVEPAALLPPIRR